MLTKHLTTLVALICLMQGAALRGDVKLPALLSDNMALQANKPVNIWGTAAPEEKVTVKLGEDTQTTTADGTGKWAVKLKPLTQGGPLEMTVTGHNTIKIKNIVVGSVWVCSGQSNMQFGFNGARNAHEEVDKAVYPKIRLFTVARRAILTPQEDCAGKWVECSPQTVQGFSAVGYFFGRDIHEATGQPVGLIHSSWGGTPAQAWTSLEGLKSEPALKHYVVSTEKTIADFPTMVAQYEKELAEYPAKLKAWEVQAAAAEKSALAAWEEASSKAKSEGKPAPPKPKAAQPPRKPASMEERVYAPTVLYGGMIAPLIHYTIEGAIWYQGESNASMPDEYATLFPTMIKDWRAHWGQGDFPFLFVQLANFLARSPHPTDTNWARLREAQTKTLALPNTGMAVIIDIGDGGNIHPTDKMDVGRRLALWAQKMVYGKSVVGSGPLYSGMKVEENRVKVSFKEIGSGLTIGVSPLSGAGARPVAESVGFAITGSAGNDGWVWAKARIEGDSVVVWSEEVKNPTAVRYAWADNPACNLYNKEGLPASPFRTDTWAMPAPATRSAPATQSNK